MASQLGQRVSRLESAAMAQRKPGKVVRIIAGVDATPERIAVLAAEAGASPEADTVIVRTIVPAPGRSAEDVDT
jgi:hypothetical protein